MPIRTFFVFLFLCLNLSLFAKGDFSKKIRYPLIDDPIDVVIVCHPKDKETLSLSIDGIKENGHNVRRVIIVSSENLTDKAEWFDESQFPFSKKQIENTISRHDKAVAAKFFNGQHRSPGWYYQQLLKLYSPLIIPNISSNVLVLDADTVFLNPVKFLNDSFGALFCVNNLTEAKEAYFQHAERLVPGYKRVHKETYSVCHHMLFQRPILEDLFHTVEDYHGKPFWKAFCLCVNLDQNKGASEFEIYFSFAFNHTKQVEVRKLKWVNSSKIHKKEEFKRDGYHFASFHTYLRGIH